MENSKVLQALYFLGIVAIPFDGMPGLGLLGELAHEGSFYFFFPALLYAGVLAIGGLLNHSPMPAIGSRWVVWSGIALLSCVAICGLINLSGIVSANFHDRGGLPKFITSTAVLVYGVALAWLTAAMVKGPWYSRLVVPISVSACICLIVCIFEAAAVRGLNFPPFQAFYSFVHSGTEGGATLWDGSPNLKVIEVWDKRLRSVSFEPPSFGNFTGLIWPWLACGVFMNRGLRRTLHIALLATFSVLIVAAQARTGWLLLVADIGTAAALWFIYLPRGGRPSVGTMTAVSAAGGTTILVAAIYYAMAFDGAVHAVIKGDSISDLTRLAYQVTALKMFLANPLFGVGLGQFAFQAANFMPSWGFLSSEIRPSMIYPDAPWPNTYMLYARVAAEMGIVGLIAWIGIWISTFVGVYRAGLTRARADDRTPWDCYVILISIVAILASGFTTDTFRTPLIWITLGAAAHTISMVARARRASALR